MKSSLRSDEIFGVPPQMKLNPSSYPDEVGFHHEVISSHDSGIYSVRKDGFFLEAPPYIRALRENTHALRLVCKHPDLRAG